MFFLFAQLAVSVDVFQHNDGIVHHHADSKGASRKGDYIDGSTEEHQHHEGAQNGNWDSEGNDERGSKAPQEDQKHHDGQDAP